MQPTYPNWAAFYSDASSFAGPGSLALDGRIVVQKTGAVLNYYTQYDATVNTTYPVAQPGPLASSFLSRILFGVNVMANHEPQKIGLDEGQYLVKGGVDPVRNYYVQETGGRGGGVAMTPIVGWKDGTLHASYPSRDCATACISVYNGPEVVTRDGFMIAHSGQSPHPVWPSQYLDYRSQSDGSLKKFTY